MNEMLSRLALSFGVGLLVGLERGWSSRQVAAGSRAAGVRTFAITGLLGGLVVAIATSGAGNIELPGALLIAAALLAYSAAITFFSRDENRASGKHSATTAIAAMLTFTLGGYAVVGNVHVAAAAAVATTGVLALREGIHGWIEKITRQELQSGLLLLAMTFIALPILPTRAVGPFGGIDLREVWVIAIALASVSFAAYVAVKYFGERRGVLVSAAIGGLVSSTVVTLTSARRAAAGEGSPHMLAAATALATAISFVRVTVIVVALSPSTAVWVGVPLAVSTLIACVFAAVIFHRSAASGSPPNVTTTFGNPFAFGSVLLMAASIGALIFVGRFLHDRFGASGTLVGAATMGLFDVDAMTISMARLASTSSLPVVPAQAILVGVASNTVVKAVIAGAIGRGRFAVNVALISACVLLAGGIALVTLRAWIPR